MKILILHMFPLWGSGSGTYVRKLGEQLAKKDQVAIVCPDKRKPKRCKLFTVKLPFFVAFTGHSEHANCRLYSNISASEFFSVYKAFFKTALEAVEKFKPDVIHVQHASFLLWIARFIRAFHNIQYVVTIHGTGIQNTSIDNRYLGLTRDALNTVKYIISVSGDTKRWFLKVYGRKYLQKMRIVPGGVDLDKFLAGQPVRAINKKYNLKDKRVILYVGKVTVQKGIEYLIKAAEHIKGDVYIIGTGPDRKRLEALTKKMALKNVHFLGYFGKKKFKELSSFFHRADVQVVPSIWDEPLGLIILEAMASQTPVVASNKGGMPMAVKDGKNGFLVRARSSKAIAEACNKILRSPKLQEKMGKEARRTAQRHFNWPKIAAMVRRKYVGALK